MSMSGFENDGWVPTVDFQYPDDEGVESEESEPPARELPDNDATRVLRAVLAWCLEPDSWRTKLIRMSAVAYVVDVFPGRRMREYGHRVRVSSCHRGVTRAAISAAAVEFCDRFGYQRPGMKTRTARYNMVVARHRVVQEGPKSTRRGRELCATAFLLRRVLRAKGATDAQISEMVGASRRTLLRWMTGENEPVGAQAERIEELEGQYTGEIQKALKALHLDPKAYCKYALLNPAPSEPTSLN